MSVYQAVYDIVAENLEATGYKPEYKKSTFLCDVEMHPQRIDISRFLELDNCDFQEAVYVTVLKRLPDAKTAAFWREREDRPKEEFQRAVLEDIAHSSVVAINQIRFVNNPYFDQKTGLRYHILGCLYGLTDKSSLRVFGKRLPKPIQKIIRRVFL